MAVVALGRCEVEIVLAVRAVVYVIPLSEAYEPDAMERPELVDYFLDHDELAIDDSPILLHDLSEDGNTLS